MQSYLCTETDRRFVPWWLANHETASLRSLRVSVMDLFFAGLCGHCNQRLFWPKSTWHKKAAAFLMSVANLWCQLVLMPHRHIWGHTGPGNIKNSHQQHSSRRGRVWWEQGSPKVKLWLSVRATPTPTVCSTGQKVGQKQDGGNALQRASAFFLSVFIETGQNELRGGFFPLLFDNSDTRPKMLKRTRGQMGT